jgi:energy-coupling factor transport system permease protein
MDLLQYSNIDTLIHRLNPVVKLLLITCFWLIAFIAYNLVILLFITGISLVLWSVARMPLKGFSRLVILLSIVFLVFCTVNGFMYYAGETPLFTLFGRWDYTLEGLIFGLTISAKVLAVVSVVPLLTMTTPLARFMAGLARVKLPYKFIFILGTAIRLTPLVEETYHDIVDAQKLRGHNISKMNFFKRIGQGYLPVFVPLILSLLRRASELDVAIESRGFGAPVKRTYVEDISMKSRDWVAVIVTILGTVGIIAFMYIFKMSTPMGLLPEFPK